MQLFDKRWGFLHHDMASIAYLLDPRFFGSNFHGPEELEMTEAYFLTLIGEQDIGDALLQLRKCNVEMMRENQYVEKGLNDPVDWWMSKHFFIF